MISELLSPNLLIRSLACLFSIKAGADFRRCYALAKPACRDKLLVPRDRIMKSERLLLTVWSFLAATHVVVAEFGISNVEQQPKRADAREPIALKKGPHLLLDEHLIARSTGVERKVIPPQRFLDAPIVTGAVEHQNWQPFFTVRHDPALSRETSFRMTDQPPMVTRVVTVG